MAPHGFQPVVKTILGDRIGNSAGGAPCFRGIDLVTARDGREHGSQGGGAFGSGYSRAAFVVTFGHYL